MQEEWRPVDGYPLYSVSTYGRVRHNEHRRIVNISSTQQGAQKVNLHRDGQQHTKSLKVLVADAFIPGKTDIFNTAIHLDGDQENCAAYNLVWRPRWFAWRYSHQFEDGDLYIDRGPIKDRDSNVVYRDIYKAGTTLGLLFYEIELSLVSNTPCLPSWRIFDWVKGNRK